MKTHVRLFPATLLVVLLVACTKETTPSDNNDDNTTELSAQSDDQSQISASVDAVANDASIAMESTTGFSGYNLSITPPICDATVTFDTAGVTKKLTITYNGTHCTGEYIRTGSVVLAMAKGTYWKNAGATVTISFQNLKLTRTRDNKSITFQGTHTITNQSGGLLINLASLHTITHTISSDMSVTFNDNTQRAWHVAQQRVFTYDNGLVITVTGTHTDGAKTGIAVWGSNRSGHAFITAITQALVLRQDCDFRITGGVVTHEGWAVATTTFGLNANGQATSCPGSGSYYCQVAWTGAAGKTQSVLLPY